MSLRHQWRGTDCDGEPKSQRLTSSELYGMLYIFRDVWIDPRILLFLVGGLYDAHTPSHIGSGLASMFRLFCYIYISIPGSMGISYNIVKLLNSIM
ncbi:hypothetical protein HanHA300_Chr02g0050971 [Helianthus annuus]|nr:hypothetical protein HanHA300_Chr02g0050971 [Helianthus annuus]